MNVVLFGGTGFVGTHLARKLASMHFNIVVPTRRPHRHRDLLVLPTLKLVKANIQDEDDINKLVENANVVVNLVGILNETGKGSSFENIHVKFPEKLAKTCLKSQVNQFIHISSIGANIDAPSAYLRSKGQAEALISRVAEQGLSTTIFRPSVIFGPDDSFTRRFEQLLKLSMGWFFLVSPESRMQPVYVQDVVECIAQAMNEPRAAGKCYELAGPEEFNLFEIVSLIDELIQGNHKIIRLSPAVSRRMAAFMQYIPGKPLTPDNLLSLQVPNVSSETLPGWFGIEPCRLADIAETYLRPRSSNRFDRYRARARR